MNNIQQLIEQSKERGFVKEQIPTFSFGTPEQCYNFITVLFPKVDQTVKEFKSIPEYFEVAKYLSNTQNKGLFLSGSVGRGKSILAEKVIPTIFLTSRYRKVLTVVPAIELGKQFNKFSRNKHLVIDDVGTEGIYKDFGNQMIPFVDIVNLAERESKFLIITTNLTLEEFAQKYGKRTIDRLVRLCHFVKFEGESFSK